MLHARAGYNYSLNTCARSYSEAEASCKLQGGHLASYGSVDEQYEVESYFMSQGLLVGSYGGYWMGAKVRSWVFCLSTSTASTLARLHVLYTLNMLKFHWHLPPVISKGQERQLCVAGLCAQVTLRS